MNESPKALKLKIGLQELFSIHSNQESENSEREHSLESFESSSMESSILSDDSLFQDAKPIFDEHFEDIYIDEIQDKRRIRAIQRKEQRIRPNFDNKKAELELSCTVLEKGIPAIKFNFSNNKSKRVIIRLINNRKTLEYTSLGSPTTLFGKVFG